MKIAKFGGSSLANAFQIKKVCEIILADPDRRIIVVSAPGKREKNDIKVTDLLIATAKAALDGKSYDEELDKVIERLQSKPQSPNPKVQNSKEPTVSVGIVSGQKIAFTLNAPYTAKGAAFTGEQTVEFNEGGILWHGQQYRELLFTPQTADASFSLHNITIGSGFHWERKQTQTFNGTLRLVVESDQITAINELSVERYLTSVISSEMSATSSVELLKAHAVISRSWLLAQMEKRRLQAAGGDSFFSFIKKDDELIDRKSVV